MSTGTISPPRTPVMTRLHSSASSSGLVMSGVARRKRARGSASELAPNAGERRVDYRRAWALGWAEPQERGKVRARAGVAVVVAMVALGACSSSGHSVVKPPSASSVARYCEEAGRLRTKGADLYLALRKAAPTKEVQSDIESVLALNDPNFTHFDRVHTYTLKTCGIDLPRYG